MKKYFISVIVLFLSVISFSQTGKLQIKGMLDDYSSGEGLSDVTIFIKEFNGDTIQSVQSNANGKYELDKVSLGKNYKVFFTKNEYIAKYCVIETDKMNSKDSTDLPIEITLSLFKGDIADYSFLQFAPVAIASYDESVNNLIWDMEYISKMKDLIDKIKNKK